MLIKLNRGASVPLYQQIIDHIIILIEDGSLSFRQALPSTRILSNQLGINRSTVCRAYEELQALGYLSSRQGSYHQVLKKETGGLSIYRSSPIPRLGDPR